jgi:hypothetical protein
LSKVVDDLLVSSILKMLGYRSSSPSSGIKYLQDYAPNNRAIRIYIHIANSSHKTYLTNIASEAKQISISHKIMNISVSSILYNTLL